MHVVFEQEHMVVAEHPGSSKLEQSSRQRSVTSNDFLALFEGQLHLFRECRFFRHRMTSTRCQIILDLIHGVLLVMVKSMCAFES